MEDGCQWVRKIFTRDVGATGSGGILSMSRSPLIFPKVAKMKWGTRLSRCRDLWATRLVQAKELATRFVAAFGRLGRRCICPRRVTVLYLCCLRRDVDAFNG